MVDAGEPMKGVMPLSSNHTTPQPINVESTGVALGALIEAPAELNSATVRRLLELESVVRYAPFGIGFTRDAVVFDWNPCLAEMLGLSDEELRGQPLRSFFSDSSVFQEARAAVTRSFEQGLAVELQFPLQRADGVEIQVDVIGYRMESTESANNVAWIITDRTESREQAESLRLALIENEAVLNSAPIGIAVVQGGVVHRCNLQFEHMLGYERGRLLGRSPRWWYADDAAFEASEWQVQEALTAGHHANLELPLRDLQGHTVWVQASATLMELGHALGGGVLWTFIDVTHRHAVDDALREALTLNRAVLDGAAVAVIATQPEGTINLFNPAACAMLGYTEAEVVGRLNPGIFHAWAEVEARSAVLGEEFGRLVVPGFETFVVKARLTGRDEAQWTYVRKDGSTLPVSLTVTPLRDASGLITGYLGIAVDISDRLQAQRLELEAHAQLEAKVALRTAELARINERLSQQMIEREAMEQQMRTMAHFDALTSLPNRNLLNDRLSHAIARAHRNSGLLAVMFLDLDRFKNINDTLGHFIGDELLKEVARRLSGVVRNSDTLARLGGDEFVLLISELENVSASAGVAEKLLESLKGAIWIAGHEIHVSTSVGISVFPQDGDTADMLLRHADAAMYSAKSDGRNRFRFFAAEMNTQIMRHYEVETALRGAVEGNELVVHYQPLIDMVAHRVYGVEALVRWNSPQLGYLEPRDFIGVAEESGLINDIDAWVMRSACRQVLEWRSAGYGDITVAVNLSARLFRAEGLLTLVESVLRETGLPPHLLELEITESCLMNHVQSVVHTLDQLVALGVRIVIDDFGTGYSSLAYIKRFRVHKLKIDQSFVRDLVSDRSDVAIVQTVVALARALDLDLLAEGVEQADQLAVLRDLGCDRFQGFLFARAMPEPQMRALLYQTGHGALSGHYGSGPSINMSAALPPVR
jgi:diguanylate cyclase (GGDEF)-like protein/PAS domain S-box-containing protein